MTVSACFITRNHEQFLERAIRSTAGVASEVIVVDTGSSDRTVAIAEECGARVCPFSWADDFSAACNFALDQATGNWVLWMNPDEAVSSASTPALAEAATRADAFAFRIRVQQELREDLPGYGTSDRQFRLFRRDPGIRYRGRLYPDFVTPLEELAARQGLNVADAGAEIHRHAYLSKPTPDKIRWVVRLLEAELRDRPGQLPYLIELGRNLLLLNDPRGHEILAEAAEQIRRASASEAPPDPAVGRLLEYLLTVSPTQSRSAVTRDEARALALRWFPVTPPVLWAAAGERFATGDFAAAADVLRRLLDLGSSRRFDPAGGFDPDIIGPAAMMNLGLCYIRLGKFDAAKECFRPLLSHATHGRRAAELLAAAERRVVNG